MASRDVTTSSVLASVAEFDRLGREAFLHKYGFGPARSYLLLHDGRHYDSKAIVGAARGYARPDLGPLRSDEFSGGLSGAAGVLRDLGFEIEGPAAEPPAMRPAAPPPGAAARQPTPTVDVVLVGCVKLKRPSRAPAEDLYISPLFRRRRAYAEASGKPWFILSAQHGLVSPETVLEPYDMALAAQGIAYRLDWGRRVVRQLEDKMSLGGAAVEIHAGAAYVDVLEAELVRRGATVQVPLRGLNQGQHLAWYSRPDVGQSHPTGSVTEDELVRMLTEAEAALPCHDFPWGRSDLSAPGLYSWWVDTAGAHALTAGLGERVPPGLVYAGQAGASSSVAGIERTSTLISRITGNHLNGGVESSTWRRSLAAALGLDDPLVLSTWMREHLRLIAVPLDDRSGLADLEERVLARLDPPLNLMHMTSTPVRSALRQARTRMPHKETVPSTP